MLSQIDWGFMTVVAIQGIVPALPFVPLALGTYKLLNWLADRRAARKNAGPSQGENGGRG